MIDKIGIDAGGTLIKIAYEENGKLHVKTYPIQEIEQLLQWLKFVAPNAILHVTGGQSSLVKNSATQKIRHIEEFQALIDGTRYLLEEQAYSRDDEYVIVNIGTGTSIFYVTPENFERLAGSGIGGGTLMGLGSMITGKKEFNALVELAANGNHERSDLLVKDIYAQNKPPLGGNLTASNFGKAHLTDNATPEDQMAALIQLIGETVIILTGQIASLKSVDKLVFVGSTLNGNSTLKNVLNSFQGMMPYEQIFLTKGSHTGAIGSLLS